MRAAVGCNAKLGSDCSEEREGRRGLDEAHPLRALATNAATLARRTTGADDRRKREGHESFAAHRRLGVPHRSLVAAAQRSVVQPRPPLRPRVPSPRMPRERPSDATPSWAATAARSASDTRRFDEALPLRASRRTQRPSREEGPAPTIAGSEKGMRASPRTAASGCLIVRS
jgi:hypothetical protein